MPGILRWMMRWLALRPVRACLALTDAAVTAVALTDAAVTAVTLTDAAVTTLALTDAACEAS